MQELEDSLTSDAPMYMEFLYRFNPKKRQIFAFYEGDEDLSYYNNILRKIFGPALEIEEIIAGCKNNVLKLLRGFNWKYYRRKQICFFVDKDLSFWLKSEHPSDNNLYVTDGYSIENYIVTEKMFHILMTEIMGFGRACKKELDIVKSKYKVLFEQFQNEMMQVMATCILAKRKNDNISLSDYKLSNALNIKLQANELVISLCNNELLKVKKLWGIDDDEAIEKLIGSFAEFPQEYHIRGKWLLYFMVRYGEYIRLEYLSFCPSLKEKAEKCLHPICTINPTKAVPVLGPRCCDIPKSLKFFIDSNYGQYLKKVD